MRAHWQALVAVVATLGAASNAAGQQAVRWQTNLDAARQMAAQSNRLLLLHFWSETCEPCARMERDVFSRPEVAATLEANYVPVKINVRQFPMTAQQFGVTAWPTDLVVTPQGQVLDRNVGYQPPAAYLGRLHQIAAYARSHTAPNQLQPPYGGAQPGRQTASTSPGAGAVAFPAPVTPSNFAGSPNSASVPSSNAPPMTTYSAAENRNSQVSPPNVGNTGSQPSAWQDNLAPTQMAEESTRRYGSALPSLGAMGQGSSPQLSGSRGSPQGSLAPNVPAYGRFSAPEGMTVGSRQTAPSPSPTGTVDTDLVGRNPGHTTQTSDSGSNAGPSASFSPDPNGSDRFGGQPVASGTASPRRDSRSAGPSPMQPRGNPPLALDGYCAVSLAEKERWVRGNPRFGVIHQGRTYLFAGPEEARRFYNDPDRYAPVASGDDIVILADHGQRVPGRREHGAWYEGRVYLFADETSYKKFAADPARYATAHAAEARNAPSQPAATSAGPFGPASGAGVNPSASTTAPASERFSPQGADISHNDPNALRQESAARY